MSRATRIQRRVYVSGVVQGVGFRQSTAREAQRFASLHGFVRNLPDGRVEALFSGEETEVLAMVAWCRKGPPAARVKELRVIEEQPEVGLEPFDVIA